VKRTFLNLAFAGVGAILLIMTVRRVGWAAVQESLTGIGWWMLAVLALGGVKFAARARAWVVSAEGSGLTFRQAFAAVLASDALGNVTPLGVLASEPAKVYFIRRDQEMVAAVSAVASENAFYIASVLVMIGFGAIAFFSRANLSDALRLAAQGVLIAVMAAAATAVWIARRQPAILSRTARAVAKWTGRGATAPDRLRELEIHFYAMLRWPAKRIAHALVWEAAFHAAAVAEVYLVLRVLSPDQSPSLMDAFVLETAGRLIIVAFKIIPYRLGVDEAGTALVARALMLDPALGVALALLRRIRILFWNAIGLVLLAGAR
jgi:uncharacterized membrane protein YbhN (UPF0104 family)